MKLPTFLIIGAQKAGTTTLYRDLLSQPGVFFPYHKEPTCLGHDKVLTDRGLREYADLYKNAELSDARGDASTGYARIPRFVGVPERASKVLGSEIKLVYLLREPVSRIVSHHHHVLSNEPCAARVDEFILEERHHTMAFTKYAFQLKAWLEYYPIEQVRVLIFEEYVKDRPGVVASLASFLGFEPDVSRINTSVRYNAAKDRSRDSGIFMAMRKSALYGRIRPLLPIGVRDQLRAALAPKAPPAPPPPSAETVDYILDSLEEDQRELADLLGRPFPIWDPDGVRQKFHARREKWSAP